MQEASPPENPAVVAALVENHRRFLAFLERRVGSRAEAEDILQAAFVRGLRKSGTVKDPGSSVAWFYRLLRNALTDHYRRAGAEARRRAGEADEADAAFEPELRGEVAGELAITPNNAAVRLHRARTALRRQLERSCGTCATHGCLDCRCGGGPAARPGAAVHHG